MDEVEMTDGERLEFLTAQVRTLSERLGQAERELTTVRQELVDAELRHARDVGRLLGDRP